MHFAVRQPVAGVDYLAVIQQLDAGADPTAVPYPTGDERIDGVLAIRLNGAGGER